MVARGGRGGLGNVHFATATHRTPRHAQRGEPAAERWLRLELRLIADIGLVGLPNAGKSTLLAALTAATPKIAAYPFTTLEPNLGVLDLGLTDPEDTRRPTIADVPGLIEGASGGAGLGHAFLRHVERTRVLLHVVDVAAPTALADHAAIREELRLHDPALLAKPGFVVANKIDLPGAAERAAELARSVAADGEACVAVSAMTGEGLPELVSRLRTLLPAAGSDEAVMPAGVVVHRFEQAARHVLGPARGGRLSRARATHRTAGGPDRLRQRGVRGTVPARSGAPGHRPGAAPRGRHGRRHRPHREPRAGLGRRAVGLTDTAVAPVPTVLPAELRARTRGAWGILGGTFDPPHYGHLAIAEHVRVALDLIGVLFVPAGIPPHKQGQPISPAADRVAMVEGAIADNSAFQLCRIEVDRPGPSYTADTLALLRADPPRLTTQGGADVRAIRRVRPDPLHGSAPGPARAGTSRSASWASASWRSCPDRATARRDAPGSASTSGAWRTASCSSRGRPWGTPPR